MFIFFIVLGIVTIVYGSIKLHRQDTPSFVTIYIGLAFIISAICVHAYFEMSEGATIVYDPQRRTEAPSAHDSNP